ncbi:MAG: hypothetical protein IKO65_03185 [Victivallales bacterium]|nr:hypothetical protein [Victivallales bacterium]
MNFTGGAGFSVARVDSPVIFGGFSKTVIDRLLGGRRPASSRHRHAGGAPTLHPSLNKFTDSESASGCGFLAKGGRAGMIFRHCLGLKSL